MSLKIAFFDIDNTLYDNANRVFPQSALSSIKLAQKNGLKVCLCTSRPNDSIREMGLYDLGIKWDAVIGSSGGTAHIDGKHIRKFTVDQDVSNRLFNYLTERNHSFEMIGLNERWLCGPFNSHAAHFYELFATTHPEHSNEVKPDLTQYHLFCTEECDQDIKNAFPELLYFRYLPFAVDILPVMYEKGDGIEDVLNYYSLTKEESIGFGDDLQDLSIAKHVKEFVAMGNAKLEVKDVATFLTKNVGDDGIKTALEHFNLI